MDVKNSLTPPARILGYAGLLPQIIAVGLSASDHEWAYVALAGGFAYAAMIFSFLGGVWWGQALAKREGSAATYLVAVAPSLLALALFLPWTFGWEWPGPALIYLGLLLIASPMVDRALGLAEPDFLILRVQLSMGLGALTVVLGVIANRIV